MNICCFNYDFQALSGNIFVALCINRVPSSHFNLYTQCILTHFWSFEPDSRRQPQCRVQFASVEKEE